MAHGVFITGTDTGIGKTWVTLALMQACKSRGISVAGMKPVASGCEEKDGHMKNNDALMIQAQGTKMHPYELINPYAFREPIAPHIAAEKSGVKIDVARIVEAYNTLAAQNDIVIVEGIGGWRVPMSEVLGTCDVVRALCLPVILVVGLRLGCINHALLTSQAVQSDNIRLAGWVANSIEQDYLETEKTIQTLTRQYSAPFLGSIPFLPVFDAEALGEHLRVETLLK